MISLAAALQRRLSSLPLSVEISLAAIGIKVAAVALQTLVQGQMDQCASYIATPFNCYAFHLPGTVFSYAANALAASGLVLAAAIWQKS